jgi:uncharacterized membrane protein
VRKQKTEENREPNILSREVLVNTNSIFDDSDPTRPLDFLLIIWNYYMVFVSQTIAVLLVIAAASLSVRKFDNTFGYTHERLGLALWILVWLAPLIGLVRPNQ